MSDSDWWCLMVDNEADDNKFICTWWLANADEDRWQMNNWCLESNPDRWSMMGVGDDWQRVMIENWLVIKNTDVDQWSMMMLKNCSPLMWSIIDYKRKKCWRVA
jgi:hypothetical protein